MKGRYEKPPGSYIEYIVRVYEKKTVWIKNGVKHRVDGPAVERSDGTKEWWRKGLRHRLDGPAIEYTSAPGSYWINGVNYDKLAFEHETQPANEYTIAQLESILGEKIKIVKEKKEI